MLTLFCLLALPMFIALTGLVITNYSDSNTSNRISIKEFIVLEAISIVLISGAYLLALHQRTTDQEFWNGRITDKRMNTTQCCHSYQCRCVSCNCDAKGNCSECCSTCYEHAYDKKYTIATSTGDEVYSIQCLSPSSDVPERWNVTKVGEPAAVLHRFTNYIRGNPNSILHLRGLAQKYKIPNYPGVYDYYRASRVLSVGVVIPDIVETTTKLEQVNADLGTHKQVNAIIVVTNSSDQEYAEGLREAWLGGKKNDVVLVIGTPNFPEIAWVSVVSWTKQEQFKIDLRDSVIGLKTWDGNRIVASLSNGIQKNYVRRKMADFEYLSATIQPSSTVLWSIGILGVVLQLIGTYWFWKNDPFNSRYHSRY